MSNTRGDGWVFQRGQIWWIQYCYRSKVFRESSRSQEETIARRLVRKRLGEIDNGVFKGPKVEKTTFEELAQDILNDYRINERKSEKRVHQVLVHLRSTFGMNRAIEITTDRINRYIIQRQEEEAANASINRELAALKRMFSLGLQTGKVATKPYIPSLKENNVRKGFFEHDDFVRLRKALPEYLRPLVTFSYFTGWRSEEVRSLRWKQVDLKNGSVRLDPGTTKNNQGRICYLPQEVLGLLSGLWQGRRLDCPWVFNREGRPIIDFRNSWETACERAGLAKMLFHDFRRTAVRNMVRAGIPERVAMQISGHKTRSIFDRYHVVNDSDLKEAARSMERFSHKQESAKILPFQGGNDRVLTQN